LDVLEDLLRRNKGSMTSLLRITAIPQMTVPPEEIEKLQEAREKEWDIGELIAMINQYKPSPIGVH
jgi:hypothetical protein